MAENIKSALLISELLNKRKKKHYGIQILFPLNHMYFADDEQREKVPFLPVFPTKNPVLQFYQ